VFRRVALYWVAALNRHRRKRVQELEEEVTAVWTRCQTEKVMNAGRANTASYMCGDGWPHI